MIRPRIYGTDPAGENGTLTQVSRPGTGKEPIEVQVYFDDGHHMVTLTELKDPKPYPMFHLQKDCIWCLTVHRGFEAGSCEAGGTKKNFCKRIVVSNGTRRIEITTVGKNR